MRILRLTQISEGEGRHSIRLRLEGNNLAPIEVSSAVSFTLTAQDSEELRWYLEEYAAFPYDPAPVIAARVERRMAELGRALFAAVFESSGDARDLWATLRPELNGTRFEVAADIGSSGIPWELLRDPVTDIPLALRVRAFVRTLPTPAQRPWLPGPPDGPVRILLAISRPGGEDDVPFRSVASRLIAALGTAADRYRLDVLRPATFARLGQVLREAYIRDEPYHVVHFDGHGAYLHDRPERGQAPIVNDTLRPGSHGYLAFEHASAPDGYELVDGLSVGALMAETQVPVLVLNACRSAHAEPLPAPTTLRGEETPTDQHAQIRTYGSLAQEIMHAGVAGVVAMRYNVYVVTAAQFVADLYASLRQGQPLGEAVSIGRKQLDADPVREIGGERVRLQDWPVPVVYEAAPLQLFSFVAADSVPRVALRGELATLERGTLDTRLPPAPDAGFFGRDETLLALDRRFDTQRVILLHGYAGSGKTATSAEFARWYALTGGIDGPVLFTSFEHPRPLARVLDDLEPFFGKALETQGIHWLALSDQERVNIALQLLRQTPVLWIWDNVEEIAGFPAPDQAVLSLAERQELAKFLRAARDTKAKFLLTSRRDERQWLGNFPALVELPPMPLPERIELARSLAEKRGHQIADVPTWLPLLRYTQGNPLTLTVVVGQALRDRLQTQDEILGYLDKLRDGEAHLNDDEADGRTRSLAASLNYGFKHAFTEEERKILAIVYVFQDWVTLDIVSRMGRLLNDAGLSVIHDLSQDELVELFDRAGQVGILDGEGGIYRIHPALPWFFADLFRLHYPSSGEATELSRLLSDSSMSSHPTYLREDIALAFMEAVVTTATYFAEPELRGHREAITFFQLHGQNIRQAYKYATSLHRWSCTFDILQALSNFAEIQHGWDNLAEHLGMLESFIPSEETDGPAAGFESYWRDYLRHKARIAFESGQWNKVKLVQKTLVEWCRQQCGSALERSPETWTKEDAASIHAYADAINELGMSKRQALQADCIDTFKTLINLQERLKENGFGSDYTLFVGYFNAAIAYIMIEEIRDLDAAELYLEAAASIAHTDWFLERSGILSELGAIAFARFETAIQEENNGDRAFHHLKEAQRLYSEGLTLTPSEAVGSLFIKHNALGTIYDRLGDPKRSEFHYKRAIHFARMQGFEFHVASGQFNLASLLLSQQRLEDALAYAHEALRIYSSLGDEGHVLRASRLIQAIEGGVSALEVAG